MKTKLSFLFLLFLETPENIMVKSSDPGEYGDYFEGDMKLDDYQMSAILYSLRRSGARSRNYRWPNNTVYYEFGPEFGREHITHIRKAFNHIESFTCIRFLPRTQETTGFINITSVGPGCYAALGYSGKPQIVNLHFNIVGKGCFKLGTVIHELLHSLGIYHQHSTYNRDKYVIIIKENIKEGLERQFNVHSSSVVSNFGLDYDYGSIMHYSSYAFTKNGKNTIVPRAKNVIIGQRIQMSAKDIKKINRMYKCSGYDM